MNNPSQETQDKHYKFFTSNKTQTTMFIISYSSLIITTVLIGFGIFNKLGLNETHTKIIESVVILLMSISWIILLIGNSMKMNDILEQERIEEIKLLCGK